MEMRDLHVSFLRADTSRMRLSHVVGFCGEEQFENLLGSHVK
jgi:hypothetical protein